MRDNPPLFTPYCMERYLAKVLCFSSCYTDSNRQKINWSYFSTIGTILSRSCLFSERTILSVHAKRSSSVFFARWVFNIEVINVVLFVEIVFFY